MSTICAESNTGRTYQNVFNDKLIESLCPRQSETFWQHCGQGENVVILHLNYICL